MKTELATKTASDQPVPVSVARVGYTEQFIATAGPNFEGEVITIPRLEGWIAVVDRIAYVEQFPTFAESPPTVAAHRILIGWVLSGGSMANGADLVELLKDDDSDHFFTLYPQAPVPRVAGQGALADLQIWTVSAVETSPRRLTVAHHYERSQVAPCQAL